MPFTEIVSKAKSSVQVNPKLHNTPGCSHFNRFRTS
uniref:Uncharacterized protein n=1 Tax=Anguilla anguilla TaxID=7936 RepID=A0A0E9WFA6_ANGAN